MSISDLTNTTWLIPSNIDYYTASVELDNVCPFNINMEVNGYTGNSISGQYDDGDTYIHLNNSGSAVATILGTDGQGVGELWNITGGNDATNSNLITWLETYAVQQTPSQDLKLYFGSSKIEKIILKQNSVEKEVTSTECIPPIPFKDATWTQIKQICQSGKAKTYWNVGDTKSIACTDGYTYQIRIVDLQEGRYSYVSDNSPTHAVFELQQTYSATQYLASSGSSVGLYKNTPMHTTYLPSILNTFNDIKNIVENVYITCITTTAEATPNYESVSAKLFLPSAVEYMDYTLSTTAFNERMNHERISPYNNTQYDVFDYYKTHTAEKKKITDGTTANTYWTRLYQAGIYWHVIGTPLNQSVTHIQDNYPALRDGSPVKSWLIFCFAL